VAHGSVSHDSCRTAHLGELTRRGKPAESLAALQLPIAPDRGSSNPGCGSIAPDRGSYPTWYLVAAGRSPQHADPRPRQIHDRACACMVDGGSSNPGCGCGPIAIAPDRGSSNPGCEPIAPDRGSSNPGCASIAPDRGSSNPGCGSIAPDRGSYPTWYLVAAGRSRSPQIVGHRTLDNRRRHIL
jgi:hypothetical protein